MDEALTAVLVFAGGVAAVGVKGWIDYALEARRERVALRAVARLADDELGGAVAYLTSVISDTSDVGWWRHDRPPFERSVWDEHAYLLATRAGLFEWPLIRRAYSTMEKLGDTYDRETRDSDLGPPLGEDERRLLASDLDMITAGIERLRRIERAPLPFERMSRRVQSLVHPVRTVRRWRRRRRMAAAKSAS